MVKNLKVKVCGMKYPQNIVEVASLYPDYMGFIFYQNSKRVVNEETFLVKTDKIKRIGVFVNETIDNMRMTVKKHQLDGVQLHGDETIEICQTMKDSTLVLKSFQIDDDFNFDRLKPYQTVVDYFLFDTKTRDDQRGGTGKKFNWKILENYTLSTAFFLSGGITLGDVGSIKAFSHPQLYGVDINSGFEEKPGIKNTQKISTFIQQIKKS